MIEVKLREDFGGVFAFPNRSEGIIWCQKQRISWINLFYRGKSQNFIQSQGANQNVRSVADLWSELESVFSGTEWENLVVDVAHPSWHGYRGIITASSLAGQSLSWIYGHLNDIALNGAFATAGYSSIDVDWEDINTSIGAFHYQRIVSGAKQFEIDEGVRNDKNKLDNLDNQIMGALADAITIKESVLEAKKSSESLLKDVEKSLKKIHEAYIADANETHRQNSIKTSTLISDLNKASEEIGQARDKGIEDLDRHRAAYREEHLLQPAAKLWSERATEHRRGAFWSGLVASGVGIVGTGVTVGVFALLRYLSRDEFASPIPTGADAKLTEEINRGALHYELAFAGAGTLLCLTMFLWLMRILVRRYTTHRRLAVDAAGRQALTLTYIGLIAEGAVNEQERPIVLASLFLPVTDNTADDGPPATSLASILAAIAAGKSGAA